MMNKLNLLSTLILTLCSTQAALAANLIQDKTVKFQKDPIAYLEKYAKENPLPEGKVYFATNVSANVWISAMGLYSGKDLIELWNPEGGEMVIYRLEGLKNEKTLHVQTVISFDSPFDGGAPLVMKAYLVKADGTAKSFLVDEKYSFQSSTSTYETLKTDL